MGNYKRGHVFQIDGNLGGITGLAEMLLQSHRGRVSILPALPPQLESGSVSGLCARGGFTVDIKWEKEQLVACTIHAKEDSLLELWYAEKKKMLECKANMIYAFDENLEIVGVNNEELL